MVGRKFGRFLVLAKLGQGGMATVWRARDELLGREVALKVLDPKLGGSAKVRRRFLHEARTVASLDHPGAVAIFDSGESEGDAYIAMRLVDGETLSDRIARRLLPIDEAVRIVRDVAEVLGHAHARGVIHRDVTSRNVMIDRDGRVFVLDFGLALANWESRVTSTGAVLGTVPYLAPEVLLGREADARSDLYSLGVVLYEALTGAFPQGEGPSAAAAFASLNSEPIPPSTRRPEISEALESVVLKAIARRPEDRHASGKDLGLELGGEGPEPGQAAQVPHVTVPSSRVVRERGTTLPQPLYLSVLRFRATEDGENRELDELAGRLSESLGWALSRLSGVRLVEAESVGTPEKEDLAAVAERVGANALLQGRVQRAGSQLRVSYTILDPWRGSPLASDVVDGSALQPFDIEDRVVASVASALGLRTEHVEARPRSRPSDPAAEERFAVAMGYMKRYDNEASVDGAIQVLERLIASEGDRAAYYATLARACLYKKEHTQQRIWETRAASACARALELDPENADVHLATGQLYLAAGRPRDAEVAYASVLGEQPDRLEALTGGALAALANQDIESALARARRAVTSAPQDWRGHSMLGWILFTTGDYEHARDSWQNVVSLTPDNARGHLNLGNALYHLDLIDEAVAEFRRSLAIQPWFRTYTSLGTALYHAGHSEEALAAFRKATELTPSDPIAWGNLGNACHWVDGHQGEASVALDRAIDLMREQLDRNSSLADGWARMAGWLANRGRREEAGSAIRRALDLAPQDAHCMVRAGHVFFQLGDRTSCLQWLGRAIQAGYGVGELMRSRELARLRDDPEFSRLVEVAGGGRGG